MKKILFSFLTLAVISTYTMERAQYVTTATEEGKKQAELINALDKGDTAQISKLLDQGIDINKPFGLFGYQGHTPLTMILKGQFGYLKAAPVSNREKIARFLITKGANPAALNPYLEEAAILGDVEKVALLLSFGAKDVNDKGLKVATDAYQHFASEKYDQSATDAYAQIIKLLEQAKKGGPVKLMPKVKPVATPVVQSTTQISDANRVVNPSSTADKPAWMSDAAYLVYLGTQNDKPAKTLPKTILKPTAKPATAQPINK